MAVYLVSGGNRGIGYDTVRLLSERDPHGTVLLGCRCLEAGAEAIAHMRVENPAHGYTNIDTVILDVTNAASILEAVATVKAKYGRLNVLINNAGILGCPDDGGPEMCFRVNVFGVHNMTEAFSSIMVPGEAKIIVVSTEMAAWTVHEFPNNLQAEFLHAEDMSVDRVKQLCDDWLHFAHGQSSTFDWPSPDTTYGPYVISNALTIAMMRRWAVDHCKDFHTAIVCPGNCSTDMTHFHGCRTSTQGAESVLFPVFEPTENGGFYYDGMPLSFCAPRPAHH
ncbi:(+)-neomenthol dehydrogenase [Achlya hypogyna]|uniref:(+)-neomenthol dehydrogenase n=1 Tax=Achlya hypogyna TaxID=1202772 RepID=A0A1V9Z3S0_ACHHY|nr:(+)-neomenthol dehydrogenase [Achlya hypogyna]